MLEYTQPFLLLDTSPSSLAPQSQCVSRLCLPELMTRPDRLGPERTWTTGSKELSLGLTAPGVPRLSLSSIDVSMESEKERNERWRVRNSERTWGGGCNTGLKRGMKAQERIWRKERNFDSFDNQIRGRKVNITKDNMKNCSY